MAISEWIAAASLAVTILSGFGAWMYRLDRNLTRVASYLESLQEANRINAEEHARMWQQLDRLESAGGGRDQRLTRLETLAEHRNERRNPSATP